MHSPDLISGWNDVSFSFVNDFNIKFFWCLSILTIKTMTNQQVMYVQPQYMYPGAQPGVVFMQTSAGLVPQYVPQQVTRDVTYVLVNNKSKSGQKTCKEIWDKVM